MKLIVVLLLITKLAFSSEHIVRVCIIETDKPIQITFAGFAVLYSEEARFQLNQQNEPMSASVSGNQIIFDGKGSKRRYLIFNDNSPFFMDVTNRSNYIIINGKYFENNRLEFRISIDKKLQIIANVPLEDYVRNVVPNEIRTNRIEELEAIKAQSIAARSYVLNNTNKYSYFDVYADVRDQVYKSDRDKKPLLDQAIAATKGQFLTYKDQLIDARYCSSLGGMREKPYYLDETEGLVILSMFYNGNFLGKESQNYRWKRQFSADDLIYLFSSFTGKLITEDSTQVLNIQLTVLERSEAGRVNRLKIDLGTNSLELSNYEVRRFFRQDNRSLPSRLFYLNNEDGQLIIQGAGYGHGQGMGQWEALDLARQGVGYRDILELFYPKTKIKVIK